MKPKNTICFVVGWTNIRVLIFQQYIMTIYMSMRSGVNENIVIEFFVCFFSAGKPRNLFNFCKIIIFCHDLWMEMKRIKKYERETSMRNFREMISVGKFSLLFTKHFVKHSRGFFSTSNVTIETLENRVGLCNVIFARNN